MDEPYKLVPYGCILYLCPEQKHNSMKKLLFLLMIPVAAAFVSCGGEKKEEAAKIPGMMEVDLTPHGYPVTIMIPDSTKGLANIEAKSWGGIEIIVGKDYQVMIKEEPGDIELRKSDITANEVNQLKRYLKEDPDLLFYETAIPGAEQSEYHFYAIVKAGESTYVVEDIPGEMFSEKDVAHMIESAKSIKAKEAEPAS